MSFHTSSGRPTSSSSSSSFSSSRPQKPRIETPHIPHLNTNVPIPTTSREIVLIVRFSQHLCPDLPLRIPSSLRVRRVKAWIRQSLPHERKECGIRLIHGGRLLEDAWRLGVGLRLQQIPLAESGGVDGDVKENGWLRSKGKGRMLDDEERSPLDRVYVHCSITSEPVSPSFLAREDAEDDVDGEAANGRSRSASSSRADGGYRNRRLQQPNTVETRPAGFDRLLSGTTGFSTDDVASLRAQFTSMISSRHTPDTMPSPTSLRRMEDQWLDTDSFERQGATSTGTDAGTTGLPGMSDEEDATNALYDSLYGIVCGFFWPLGALFWGLRNEGVWSRRRGFAVLAGIGVNVGFGLVRLLS